MRRKLSAGQRPVEDFTVTVEKALGQALTRAAQELMEMPLRVIRLQESRLTLADLPEMLEDRALLALLAGPGEAMGLLSVGPAMLAGLIEMRTVGRLSQQAPPPRRPTRTDAALAADFLDASLAALEEALAGSSDRVWAGGFRYASFLDDPRPLPLMLEDAAYRGFRFEIEMGAPGQARPGTCLLVLPAEGRGTAPEPPPVTAPPRARDQGGGADWSRLLEAALLDAPGELNGVLARVTLPLGRLLGLAVGQLLDLPAGSIEATRVEGPGGRLICHARLGRQQGQRALRLTLEAPAAPPLPAWADHSPRRSPQPNPPVPVPLAEDPPGQ